MESIMIRKETLTRRKMLNALKSLLMNKNIEDIKIQSIREKSGAGQGSFYNHFGDLYTAKQILIIEEEAACWRSMLQYYSCISAGSFSQKLESMAINLTTYIKSSITFQRIVGENAS